VYYCIDQSFMIIWQSYSRMSAVHSNFRGLVAETAPKDKVVLYGGLVPADPSVSVSTFKMFTIAAYVTLPPFVDPVSDAGVQTMVNNVQLLVYRDN
jgi:hypothetical protein